MDILCIPINNKINHTKNPEVEIYIQRTNIYIGMACIAQGFKMRSFEENSMKS